MLHLQYTPQGGADLDIPDTADKNGILEWDWAPTIQLDFSL